MIIITECIPVQPVSPGNNFAARTTVLHIRVLRYRILRRHRNSHVDSCRRHFSRMFRCSLQRDIREPKRGGEGEEKKKNTISLVAVSPFSTFCCGTKPARKFNGAGDLTAALSPSNCQFQLSLIIFIIPFPFNTIRK